MGKPAATGGLVYQPMRHSRKFSRPVVHVNEKDTIGFKIYDPLEGGSARGEHRGAYYGVVRPILEWNTAYDK